MQKIRPPIKNKWRYVLHKLFDHPALVLIGGIWKSGKTDFALLIAETLQKLPYDLGEGMTITDVASNIDTKGHYPMISDLVNLRIWLYSNNHRKLYVLDEASEHLSSRRSMSTKNVGFVSIIPEISKAHGRLLVIGHQLMTVDKTLLDDVWTRGIFIKLGLKKAQLISHMLHAPFVFNNIPKTTVPFDAYAVAPFSEKPSGSILFKDADRQLLWDWSNGKTIKDLNIHATTLNRLCRKYVRTWLENDSHILRT